MLDISKSTIIVPLIRAKDKSAARGCYVIKNGKLFFQSGRDIVHICEHFKDSGATPERLIENTVRYENGNLPVILENRDKPCYNDKINDVL